MSKEENVSRRNVLKNVGGLGTVPLLSAAASARDGSQGRGHGRSKSSGEDADGWGRGRSGHSEEDVSILAANPKDRSSGLDDANAVAEAYVTSNMASEVVDRTSFQQATDQSISFSIETDDAELNQRDPAITYIPFRPENDHDLSVDNVGVMFVSSVVIDGERQAAASWAFSREDVSTQPGTQLSTQEVSEDSVVMRTYGQPQSDGQIQTQDQKGSVTVTSEQVVQAQSDNQVSAQDTEMSCWMCTIVVDAVCIAGASTITYSACLEAALATSALGPQAAGAVGTLCGYLVNTLNGAITCTAGTAAICGSVLDDCQYTD